MRRITKLEGKAGRGIFGKRAVGLSADEVRKNVLYGTAEDRDETWPLGQAKSNPVAKAVTDATKEAHR